jgi:DnaJ-class molecular chaperone
MAKLRIPKKYRVPREQDIKQKVCTACNGSGYYDHNGSPPCGVCSGTGKEEGNE